MRAQSAQLMMLIAQMFRVFEEALNGAAAAGAEAAQGHGVGPRHGRGRAGRGRGVGPRHGGGRARRGRGGRPDENDTGDEDGLCIAAAGPPPPPSPPAARGRKRKSTKGPPSTCHRAPLHDGHGRHDHDDGSDGGSMAGSHSGSMAT